MVQLSDLAKWSHRPVGLATWRHVGALVVMSLLLAPIGHTNPQTPNDPRGQPAFWQTQLLLQTDPAKALAFMAEAGKKRGAATPDDYFAALTALTKGVGWEISHPLTATYRNQSVRGLAFTPAAAKNPADCATCWPQRQWLAWAWSDGAVAVADLGSGSPPKVLGNGGQARSDRLFFSPNGRWLVSRSWDNNVKVWDLAAGLQDGVHPHWKRAADKLAIHDAKFSADSKYFLLQVVHELLIFDTATWQEQRRIPQVARFVTRTQNPDELITSGPDHTSAPAPRSASPQEQSAAQGVAPLSTCSLHDGQCASLNSPFYWRLCT